MDAKLVTMSGLTVLLYHDEENDTLEMISMHQLSHDLQSALDQYARMESGSLTVPTVGDNKLTLRLAIALVDHLINNADA